MFSISNKVANSKAHLFMECYGLVKDHGQHYERYRRLIEARYQYLRSHLFISFSPCVHFLFPFLTYLLFATNISAIS